MRSPPDGLAPGVLADRLISQTLRDITRLVNEAARVGGERRAGAGVTAFDEWVHAHEHREFYRGVFNENIEAVEQLFAAAEDHVHALLATLRSGRSPTTSLFVLERAIVEAALRVCWLLDGNLSPERALARMMVVQLEQIEGELAAAEAFRPTARVEERRIRDNIADFHREMDRHGFTRTPDRRRPERTSSIAIGGARETANINVTDAVRAYMPLVPWQWHLSSAAAHARPWMLASMLDTTERRASPSAHADACLAITLSLLGVADALAETAHSHTGVEVGWFHKAVHQRRLALTTRARGDSSVAVGFEEYRTRSVVDVRRASRVPATFRGSASFGKRTGHGGEAPNGGSSGPDSTG